MLLGLKGFRVYMILGLKDFRVKGFQGQRILRLKQGTLKNTIDSKPRRPFVAHTWRKPPKKGLRLC
jgi:hypothetical protein